MTTIARRPPAAAFALLGLFAILGIVVRAARESRSVVVIYSGRDQPGLRVLEDRSDRCRFIDLDAAESGDAPLPASIVVVTGHSLPPLDFLHGDARRLADSIAKFRPGVVVLDTCYGASSAILEAIADQGIRPIIVGPTTMLPPTGLFYPERFFDDSLPLLDRARSIQALDIVDVGMATEDDRCVAPSALTVWKLDPLALADSLRDLENWSPAKLEAALQRVHPNLVRVPLRGSDATMLVAIPPDRFRVKNESDVD